MGVIDSFMGAGLFVKIAFIILLLAQFCSWIAFTTSGWGKVRIATTDTYTTYGLWRSCSDSDGFNSCGAYDGTRNDWLAATQAFAIFGFVGINVSFLIIVLQIFAKKCMDLSFVNAIICFVAAVGYLLAVIIFAVKFDDYYWYGKLGMSFGFAIVALILATVAGILLILGAKKGGTSPA